MLATVRLWELGSRGIFCVRCLQGHADSVNGVAYSPDSGLLATASADSTVKVWEPISGRIQQTIAAHATGVLSVSFSPDGKKLVTAGEDGVGLVWDVASGQPAKPGMLRGHGGAITSASWSPIWQPSRLLLTTSMDRTARIWSNNGVEECLLRGHSDEVTSSAWAPDGASVATTSQDGSSKLWDVSSGDLLATLEGHRDAVMAVVYSPAGDYLATGGAEGSALLWTPEGKLLQQFSGHQKEIMDVAFAPDGRCLVTASEDRTAKLWNVKSGDCLATLCGHDDGIVTAAFRPQPDSGHVDRTMPEAPDNSAEYSKDPSKWLNEL
eukprot:TRINITY_DN27824_c0_g1_i2.p1 TRINITY_DN27824_c0_g1~~TRINITY_DN27824_c0_g1_i2.p1  ORF type:complete len:323 (-),score=35.27 TRINITY_DN27824_c0_g1_i2:158-1126(-)